MSTKKKGLAIFISVLGDPIAIWSQIQYRLLINFNFINDQKKFFLITFHKVSFSSKALKACLFVWKNKQCSPTLKI